MGETFVSLEQAAELEGVAYKGMASRISRNTASYKVKTERPRDGGKDRVLVALSSLSKKARKLYKETLKVNGSDVVTEKRTEAEAPWYVEVDLNWYIQNNSKEYYGAVELAKSVREFLNYCEADRTRFADEFARKLGISQRTLYRHSKVYLEASAWASKLGKDEGKNYEFFKILALCRKPKADNTFPSLTAEARAIIENIWFDKGFAANAGTIEMLYWKLEQIAGQRGWEIPSYKTVARYIKHVMDSGGQSVHFLAANGMREFRNKKMIKGKRDTTSLAVMEFVQGDGHTFDCWVAYKYPNGKVQAVRPKLVSWIDTRSRVVMGDVMDVTVGAQVVKESVVKMIYEWGTPKHLHIDNGKEYTAEAMLGQSRKERTPKDVIELDSETLGFVRSIGVEDWSRSLPHQPWGKGQKERFFGTVTGSFTKWMDSYVGTLTGSRTAAKKKKDIKKMLERGQLLWMDEFYALWKKWLTEFYHQREHSSLKKDGEKHTKPIELYANAEDRYVKPAPPRSFAAMLLMKADKALVRNQGITKFGHLYTDYELHKYVGETVGIKWDIDDVTKLYVFDKDGRKICEAASAELLAIAPRVPQEALETHLRNQKRQLKETREALDYYQTPFEYRGEVETPAVVGGLDLTIKAKRDDKVVALPQDKEYRSDAKASKEKRSDSEFIAKRGEEALSILRRLG